MSKQPIFVIAVADVYTVIDAAAVNAVYNAEWGHACSADSIKLDISEQRMVNESDILYQHAIEAVCNFETSKLMVCANRKLKWICKMLKNYRKPLTSTQ